MLLNILKKDFLRKKIITIALFLFILLSALFVASSSNMIIELLRAIDELFAQSRVPHFVQLNMDEIDQTLIDQWTSNNPLVSEQQTVEMLNIDSINIYFGDSQTPESGSVMDFDFVTQNPSFDFLLDLDNQIIHVSEGEVAVPIYFQQEKNIQIGDKVKIANQSFELSLTVTSFVRDVQMNPAIISSKRFVINNVDFETLKTSLGSNLGGQIEYLIEFRLTDENQSEQFITQYQSSNLPQQGPPIDINLFRTLNALTDGLVASIIILISILLMIVAMLCLRFTILVTIEEDYTEIGVMKAIGIQPHQIRRIYLTKYIVMAALASIIGYLLSFVVSQQLVANITLYMGNVEKSFVDYLIIFATVVLIFLSVVGFCMLVLRRFNKISAVEALRLGSAGETTKNKWYLSLVNNRLPVNIFLGLQDVVQRFRIFRILFVVFGVCTFIIIVPLNFSNTLQSPDFVTYMGVSQTDLRIDIQLSDSIHENFNNVINYIENDNDVAQFLSLTTYQLKVINDDGSQENINVEVGDFSVFPLEYLQGNAPINAGEISLSYLNANQLEKNVGDQLQLLIDGQEKTMMISGIYQDITNGGRTAKVASLPSIAEIPLRYVIILNLNPDINLQDKVDEYATALQPAKVTDVPGYIAQTLGTLIQQSKLITIIAFIIAIILSVLVTSLFLQMLIAKDFSQIAIMKSLGFSLRHIKTQYITKSLLILNVGIIIGTIISNTVGQSLVSALLSILGAASIRFVINPVQAYILSPLTLIIVVTITTLVSSASIKEFSIAKVIRE